MYSPFKYARRHSSVVKIGEKKLGGTEPVLLQSMANTDTNDIEKSVQQCVRIIDSGADIVRFTTQGAREVENLKIIHDKLRNLGYSTPLVADVHFNANVADVAAQYVEKVRINPGNYIGSIKRKDDNSDYTEEEFKAEYEKIHEQFTAFLDICKHHGTAIRIGVNHGSLSERMMNRYGDTSQGMVESCMEFLKICCEQNFSDVVISMKTSNTVMMVYTVRLLCAEMEKHNMNFPLHLGVTEAGDGEDGRIKSAVGIGTLLADGIGDTIRVSLSEDPEAEIPVARTLVDYTSQRADYQTNIIEENPTIPHYEYRRRKSTQVKNIGGDNVPIVIAGCEGNFPISPDFILAENVYQEVEAITFFKTSLKELDKEFLQNLKERDDVVLLLSAESPDFIGEIRAVFNVLKKENCNNPVIICKKYAENDLQTLQIKAATDFGALLIDGFGDGVFIENEGIISQEQLVLLSYSILQAVRLRMVKTEYISCPGCGRTMFDLQNVIAKVKVKTSHLTGLKIGIMGCIVNGPGEMADADYGYVGAGRGNVSLYKKKTCVMRNIPENEAVERLIELIKANGDWQDCD
jgi:1-hydroxy-2-methyl-2-(E)-butenyl 4-diphosphate synthase